MKRLKIITILMIISVFIIGCTSQSEKQSADKPKEKEEKTELMISAAISLTDALDEIKTIYEKEHPVELTFNLGGSGSLAQQIQQGVPTDIFISANETWMDTLENEELIHTDSRVDITGNNLVLITNESSEINYQSVDEINPEDVDKIAIGNPESVPAGAYSEQALHHLNMWDELNDNNKLVLAKDVRQVLTYVETGNADIGFIYESDAQTSDKINILTTVDKDLHDPVIYPAAVIADTEHEKEAADFVAFMEMEQAQKILSKYGFKK
ncbi:molybdate transport system substrate-binding protein [Virgibacillus halotolerans]|uniref:molybdate ABC transporter substrate-binding protein n=1 Tax=Virgibacillus halotolerans TaxID=1071053 RepID=UPI001961FE8C|nr:molybdate ABC transporter substrate-binding protein [Virgibacillus halotolerans]MBM7602008.1 molybdate transport system substrate-binding protein [Virgibacillus halotolerans]